MESYIRFGWAMKRLLREKANHEILEGFMESLLGEKFTIVDFLESEDTRKSSDHLDMLVKNSKDELFVFELQNEREYTSLERILIGDSKAITDYTNLGDNIKKVKRVYSISIVYFDLGPGKDYVYHGMTQFRSSDDNILSLSQQQIEILFGQHILTEHYILRLHNFDKVSVTPLDEWIYFLKTSKVTPESTAPGLDRVRECMKVDSLSKADREDYNYYLEMLRDQRSMMQSGIMDGMAKGREEGIARKTEEIIERMLNKGFSVEEICECIACSAEEVLRLKSLKGQ